MELTGRLTADASIHTTKKNKQVVHFTLAVNDRYKASGGEYKQETQFYRCSYWIGTGVVDILTKGSVVTLFGRISASAWIGRDDKPRASLDFHTNSIKKQSGPRKGEGAATAHQGGNDDMPF